MLSCQVLVLVPATEFHPGVPWKGLQNIDPENDPDVTPGSVPSGPTINTTIQDVNRYLLKSGGGHRPQCWWARPAVLVGRGCATAHVLQLRALGLSHLGWSWFVGGRGSPCISVFILPVALSPGTVGPAEVRAAPGRPWARAPPAMLMGIWLYRALPTVLPECHAAFLECLAAQCLRLQQLLEQPRVGT